MYNCGWPCGHVAMFLWHTHTSTLPCPPLYVCACIYITYVFTIPSDIFCSIIFIMCDRRRVNTRGTTRNRHCNCNFNSFRIAAGVLLCSVLLLLNLSGLDTNILWHCENKSKSYQLAVACHKSWPAPTCPLPGRQIAKYAVKYTLISFNFPKDSSPHQYFAMKIFVEEKESSLKTHIFSQALQNGTPSLIYHALWFNLCILIPFENNKLALQHSVHANLTLCLIIWHHNNLWLAATKEHHTTI